MMWLSRAFGRWAPMRCSQARLAIAQPRYDFPDAVNPWKTTFCCRSTNEQVPSWASSCRLRPRSSSRLLAHPADRSFRAHLLHIRIIFNGPELTEYHWLRRLETVTRADPELEQRASFALALALAQLSPPETA